MKFKNNLSQFEKPTHLNFFKNHDFVILTSAIRAVAVIAVGEDVQEFRYKEYRSQTHHRAEQQTPQVQFDGAVDPRARASARVA